MTEETTEVEEVAETPAPETPEVAETPAAESTPEPAVETSTEPVADPTPDTASTHQPITPDSFRWDDWDGSTDALAEPIRPWVEKAVAWKDSTLDEDRERVKQLEELYNGLMNGLGDPRVDELTKTRDALQQEYDAYKAQAEAWKTERETAVQTLQEREAAWNTAEEAKTKAQVDAWQKENAWIFEKDETKTLASELLKEGWDYKEELPLALKLPAALRDRARKLFVDHGAVTGTGKLVLQAVLAEATAAQVANPSQDLVSGTTTPQVTAQRTTTPDPSQISDQDRKLAVVRRLMKRSA